jgi:TIR domain
MFYFRSKPFFTADLSEWRQFQEVLEFRRKLQKFGVLFWEYIEPIELSSSSVVSEFQRAPYESNCRPLYEALKAEGFSPWIDVRDIIPGKNWVAEIEKTIWAAHFFIAFVSQNSVDKQVRSVTGFSVGSEINIALERISEAKQAAPDVTPDPRSYMIPARLDPVTPQPNIAEFQWVDLFEPRGLQSLIDAIRSTWERRTRRGRRTTTNPKPLGMNFSPVVVDLKSGQRAAAGFAPPPRRKNNNHFHKRLYTERHK